MNLRKHHLPMDNLMNDCIAKFCEKAAAARDRAILDAFADGLHMDDIAGIREWVEYEDNKIIYRCAVVTVSDIYSKEPPE
jgi:hypothetical protein